MLRTAQGALSTQTTFERPNSTREYLGLVSTQERGMGHLHPQRQQRMPDAFDCVVIPLAAWLEASSIGTDPSAGGPSEKDVMPSLLDNDGALLTRLLMDATRGCLAPHGVVCVVGPSASHTFGSNEDTTPAATLDSVPQPLPPGTPEHDHGFGRLLSGVPRLDADWLDLCAYLASFASSSHLQGRTDPPRDASLPAPLDALIAAPAIAVGAAQRAVAYGAFDHLRNSAATGPSAGATTAFPAATRRPDPNDSVEGHLFDTEYTLTVGILEQYIRLHPLYAAAVAASTQQSTEAAALLAEEEQALSQALASEATTIKGEKDGANAAAVSRGDFRVSGRSNTPGVVQSKVPPAEAVALRQAAPDPVDMWLRSARLAAAERKWDGPVGLMPVRVQWADFVVTASGRARPGMTLRRLGGRKVQN
jgi:hypothetical protein